MAQVTLESAVFQIRYAFGHRYLDRCGQTLVDFERTLDGWIAGGADPSNGTARCPKHDLSAEFNSKAFTLVARRPPDISNLSGHAFQMWKIVRSNLGLEELIRVGLRLYYLQATADIESADEAVRQSTFTVSLPDQVKRRFNLLFPRPTAVVEKDSVRYRLELKAVTRDEAVLPLGELLDPRQLSKHQREVRIQQMSRRAAYERNPTFAISFDVDCVVDEPGSSMNPKDFIETNYELVEKEFKSIIERIG